MSRLALTPELRPALRHAPAPLAALESAHAAACSAVDPALAEALRRRIAASVGLTTGEGPSREPTVSEAACSEFADQFVAYVPGIGDAHRAAVADGVGPDRVLDVARMIYVFDMTDRLVLALGRLFPPLRDDPPAADLEPVERQPLGDAVPGLHAAAMQLHELDPVTTELVRLHCARYHDCKT